MNEKQTKNQLLLGTVKPCVEVVSSTIAHWFHFQRPFVRLTSTSKAATQGFSVRETMDRANWSGASAFKTFYHKVIVQQYNKFEKAVLDINTGAS